MRRLVLFVLILLASISSAQTGGVRTVGPDAVGPGSGVMIETKGGVLLTPAGAADVMIWRAPFSCTVTKVQGHMAGGTSAAVNARKNGASALLGSDLAVTVGAWSSTTTIQNASFSVGDYLEVRLISLVGSPSTVTIQVECTR